MKTTCSIALALVLLSTSSFAAAEPEARVEATVTSSTSVPGRAGGALLGMGVVATATLLTSGAVFAIAWGADGFRTPCLLYCGGNGGGSGGQGMAVGLIAGIVIDVLGAGAMPIAAWLGHKLAGGDGSFGHILLGWAGGIVTGAALAAGGVFVGSASNGQLNGVSIAMATAGALAFVMGPLLAGELSHRAVPKIGLAPTSGGGMVSLAWAM